jgi:hypothetical protein
VVAVFRRDDQPRPRRRAKPGHEEGGQE